jgi:hypothetical protein
VTPRRRDFAPVRSSETICKPISDGMTRLPLSSRLTCRVASELFCLAILLGGLFMLVAPSVGLAWMPVVAIGAGAYGAYVNHEASRRLVTELRRRPAV